MKKSLIVVVVAIFTLQGCGSTPGEYTHSVMSSSAVDALMRDASGNGAGLQTYDASAEASDGSYGNGYRVSARRTASHQTFGGQVMLPRGVQRNQPMEGGNHGNP